MVRARGSRWADAIEGVLIAYAELTKTIGRSEGACIEEIQAAVEYLLDAVKAASRETPLRDASGPGRSK